ncbi:hypothetical protein D3C81_08610 [compost metagenome]
MESRSISVHFYGMKDICWSGEKGVELAHFTVNDYVPIDELANILKTKYSGVICKLEPKILFMHIMYFNNSRLEAMYYMLIPKDDLLRGILSNKELFIYDKLGVPNHILVSINKYQLQYIQLGEKEDSKSKVKVVECYLNKGVQGITPDTVVTDLMTVNKLSNVIPKLITVTEILAWVTGAEESQGISNYSDITKLTEDNEARVISKNVFDIMENDDPLLSRKYITKRRK